jgi:hypothetical protein
VARPRHSHDAGFSEKQVLARALADLDAAPSILSNSS